MARLPDNPDRDFSAKCTNDIHDETVEEMFASYIVGYGQLLHNSQVRFRIGEIIDHAKTRPNRYPRRHKSR